MTTFFLVFTGRLASTALPFSLVMQHVLSFVILCLCSVLLLAVNFGIYQSLQAAEIAVDRHVLHVLETTQSRAFDVTQSPVFDTTTGQVFEATTSQSFNATTSQSFEATTSSPTSHCSNHSFSVIIVTHNEPLLYKT